MLLPTRGYLFLGPLYFGVCAFFWLGAIRLVFSLHAQCFVNSICHSEPGVALGEDSSRNVRWLGLMHFLQGENWHRNHHARPGSARLGWSWRQPDVGYLVIVALERKSTWPPMSAGRMRRNASTSRAEFGPRFRTSIDYRSRVSRPA